MAEENDSTDWMRIQSGFRMEVLVPHSFPYLAPAGKKVPAFSGTLNPI
jgi:hypothetical protein